MFFSLLTEKSEKVCKNNEPFTCQFLPIGVILHQTKNVINPFNNSVIFKKWEKAYEDQELPTEKNVVDSVADMAGIYHHYL